MRTSKTGLPVHLRSKSRIPSVNWTMIFVIAVVVLGIVLIATGEFGAV